MRAKSLAVCILMCVLSGRVSAENPYLIDARHLVLRHVYFQAVDSETQEPVNVAIGWSVPALVEIRKRPSPNRTTLKKLSAPYRLEFENGLCRATWIALTDSKAKATIYVRGDGYKKTEIPPDWIETLSQGGLTTSPVDEPKVLELKQVTPTEASDDG